MKIKDIYDIIDNYAPFDLAEDFDNVGLLLGSMTADVDNILLALDVTNETLNEAKRIGANLIICHHPFIFSPIKTVDVCSYVGSLIKNAIKNDINIIAAHTNLDNAKGGLNDFLAGKLGLKGAKPLTKSAKYPKLGAGRIGVLNKSLSLLEFSQKIKKLMDVDKVKIVGDTRRKVKKIALCSGSGGSLCALAISHDADCYVSGEIKYSMALEAKDRGMSIIDISHYASEIFCINILEMVLTKGLKALRKGPRIFKNSKQTDPFQLR